MRLLLESGDPAAVDKLVAPKEFFTACYHRLLCCGDAAAAPPGSGEDGDGAGGKGGADAAGGMRQLCVKAMAAAYSAHAHTIGPFEGLPHVLGLMDATPARDLRDGLLLLLRALIAPRAAGPPAYVKAAADAAAAAVVAAPPAALLGGKAVPAAGAAGQQAAMAAAAAAASPQRAAALRTAKANGYQLMDAGGLQLLVDVVAGAHECSERRAVGSGGVQPLGAGSLLTSVSHAEAPKEWSYFPPAADGADPPPHPVNEAGAAGPIERAEVKALFRSGAVNWDTPFQAPGMPQPLPLSQVRELRWALARGPGLLSPFEAAGAALDVMRQLAALQPAIDERGQPLQPLPRAHVALAAPGCLPHIAQVMLTGEPALVAAAAALLESILAGSDEAVSRLYLTGAFFFGLAYVRESPWLRSILDLLSLCCLATVRPTCRSSSPTPT